MRLENISQPLLNILHFLGRNGHFLIMYKFAIIIKIIKVSEGSKSGSAVLAKGKSVLFTVVTSV